jgi:hypothetical protein
LAPELENLQIGVDHYPIWRIAVLDDAVGPLLQIPIARDAGSPQRQARLGEVPVTGEQRGQAGLYRCALVDPVWRIRGSERISHISGLRAAKKQQPVRVEAVVEQ